MSKVYPTFYLGWVLSILSFDNTGTKKNLSEVAIGKAEEEYLKFLNRFFVTNALTMSLSVLHLHTVLFSV